MNFFLSSKVNMHSLEEFIPIATMISSNKLILRSIISQCPKVNGSNDPGKIAFFIFQNYEN